MTGKRWIGLGIGLIFAAAIVLLSLNVSIAQDIAMAGGCISVSFDKWDMRRADKMVVTCKGAQYVSEDTEFVRDFAEGTLAGTMTDYCCAKENYATVEIYRGDRLLRRYRYVENHDAFAYEADGTHWVLFGEESHAFVSGETIRQFRRMLGLNTYESQSVESSSILTPG